MFPNQQQQAGFGMPGMSVSFNAQAPQGQQGYPQQQAPMQQMGYQQSMGYQQQPMQGGMQMHMQPNMQYQQQPQAGFAMNVPGMNVSFNGQPQQQGGMMMQQQPQMQYQQQQNYQQQGQMPQQQGVSMNFGMPGFGVSMSGPQVTTQSSYTSSSSNNFGAFGGQQQQQQPPQAQVNYSISSSCGSTACSSEFTDEEADAILRRVKAAFKDQEVGVFKDNTTGITKKFTPKQAGKIVKEMWKDNQGPVAKILSQHHSGSLGDFKDAMRTNMWQDEYKKAFP